MQLPEMTEAEYQSALEEAMLDLMKAEHKLKTLIDSRKSERILDKEDST
jgi:hypothetical protein